MIITYNKPKTLKYLIYNLNERSAFIKMFYYALFKTKITDS